jgi:hypothetical protein
MAIGEANTQASWDTHLVFTVGTEWRPCHGDGTGGRTVLAALMQMEFANPRVGGGLGGKSWHGHLRISFQLKLRINGRSKPTA